MLESMSAVAARPIGRRRLLAAAGLAFCLASGLPAKAQDTIKVGVLHSLSGTMAISETTLKDTILMMIDAQNKNRKEGQYSTCIEYVSARLGKAGVKFQGPNAYLEVNPATTFTDRATGEKLRSAFWSWPERLREGDLHAGDYDESARRYHLYVQWLADEQLLGQARGRLQAALRQPEHEVDAEEQHRRAEIREPHRPQPRRDRDRQQRDRDPGQEQDEGA